MIVVQYILGIYFFKLTIKIEKFYLVILLDLQILQVNVNLLILSNFLIEFIQHSIQLLIDMMFIKLKQLVMLVSLLQ
jgi:hypothetical protein